MVAAARGIRLGPDRHSGDRELLQNELIKGGEPEVDQISLRNHPVNSLLELLKGEIVKELMVRVGGDLCGGFFIITLAGGYLESHAGVVEGCDMVTAGLLE
jgi:hypothetical protein